MTGPEPTPDEEALFAFRRDVVLAASAGTGKTHALVGVVVHLVMGASSLGTRGLRTAIDPCRIVATTFSRKAALEIRTRLRDELERLASPDGHAGSPYLRSLHARVASAGLAPWSASAVTQRARRALDGLHRAEIGTLHGVAASLVRRHALEAGLPAGFEIASEEDERARRERAIEVALENAFPRAGHAVHLLVESAGGVDALVERLADALARLAEDGRPLDAFQIDAGDEARIEARVASLVRAASRVGAPRFTAPARALREAWAAVDEDVLETALVSVLTLENRSRERSPEEIAFFELRDGLPGVGNAARARILARSYRGRHAFGEVARVAREILGAALRDLDAGVRRGDPLGFSDVLRVARDLLRDHVGVAREVGARHDVLLVDECQDTSRLQRDLVTLLWARDAARRRGEIPGLGDVRPAGLFVVGDRKQSIYGFRGADVGVFAEMCVGLAGAPAAAALRIPPELAETPVEPLADFFALRHNRRSGAALLRFTNAFSAAHFAPAFAPAALHEIEYASEIEDLRPPDGGPGTADDGPAVTWLRVEAAGKASTRLEEAQVIAERIAEEVRAGVPLARTGVRPTYRDVAVLAQTNEMLDTVAHALAGAGIPYVSVGRGFYAAREVHDLVDMLALLVDPSDRLALLGVLRGPWAGVLDDTLVGLTAPGEGLLPPERWDEGPRRALVDPGDASAVSRVRDVVTRASRVVDRLGPARALSLVADELGFLETIARLPRGERRVANARRFLEVAAREPSARLFLRRVRRRIADDALMSEAQVASGEDDAVVLLTVHASKGLDFALVFVPELGATPRPTPRPPVLLTTGDGGDGGRLAVRFYDASLEQALEPPGYEAAWLERKRRERAEKQRLIYVAVTRARERMYVVGSRDTPSDDHAAATLAALAATPGSERFLEVVAASVPAPLLHTEVVAGDVQSGHAPARRALPVVSSLDVAPTALADFHHCARRFQLVHLLAFPEHTHGARWTLEARGDRDAIPLDARREGTLVHGVLERVPPGLFGAADPTAEVSKLLASAGIPLAHAEHDVHTRRISRFLGGTYARRVRMEQPTILREHAFLLDLAGGVSDPPDAETPRVTLRGTMDLVVLWPDRSVDVIDYKRARGPRMEPYAFQLDVYALAIRALADVSPTRVRTGILFLGGESGEPAFRDEDARPDLPARVLALASSLRRARHDGVFPRADVETCHAIHCGYVGRCHPEARPRSR